MRKQKMCEKNEDTYMSRMRILLRILIAKMLDNLYDETIDFSKQSKDRSNKTISISRAYVVSNFSNLSFSSFYESTRFDWLQILRQKSLIIDDDERAKICEDEELNW